MTLDLFLLHLVLAGATAGLAIFVRACPWPKSWLAVKPLACPACMSGWSGFAVLGLAHWARLTASWTLPHFALAWLMCIGISALLFKMLYPPEVDLPLP